MVRGQFILTPASDAFVKRVSWHGDLAAGWRPHDDPHSPVLMTHDVRFGKPVIKGISTEVLSEHDEAGEDVEGIAEALRLEPDEVRWALAYETSARAAGTGRRSRRQSASTWTLTCWAWPRSLFRSGATRPTRAIPAALCTSGGARQRRTDDGPRGERGDRNLAAAGSLMCQWRAIEDRLTRPGSSSTPLRGPT